jgi:hypothetical protein
MKIYAVEPDPANFEMMRLNVFCFKFGKKPDICVAGAKIADDCHLKSGR